MDPAGLLINVATIAITIDEIQGTFNSASGTLDVIRSQIKILETGVQRIQEWLHFTDPTSKAQVMHSLQDAVATVNAAVERLQDDLAAITRTGPRTTKLLGRTGSDQWIKTKFAINETRMRKHLTDVRECVSLVHFTLSVCQLPVGKSAEREVKELRLGANALNRAQSSARQERLSVMIEQNSERDQDHSEDYNTFVKSVLAAEEDLPDDTESEVSSKPPSRQSSWGMSPSSPDPLQADRDELYLPAANRSPISAKQDHASVPHAPDRSVSQPAVPSVSSSHSPYAVTTQETLMRSQTASGIPLRNGHAVDHTSPRSPARPPKLPEAFKAVRTQSQLQRKPVNRPSISEGSASTSAAFTARSPDEKNGVDRSADSLVPPQINGNGSTAGPSTRTLFNQASRSLSSLTDDYAAAEGPVDADDPPPYVDTATPSTHRDVKRTITESSSSNREQSAIQHVRDNRMDLLREILSQGADADESDPTTKRTALMEAVSLRRSSACRLLIRSGSRLHLKDVAGNSALHLAAAQGDADFCQMLLEMGAQVDEHNQVGATPLSVAAGRGSTESVLLLLNSWTAQNANGITLLKGFEEACKSGNVSTAQAFLDRGVKPKKLKEAWKPLAHAAQSGSIPMVDFMLHQKCSLKERSPDGWTALHFASAYGHTALVEKLLALKLSWKAQTKKTEETALHLAIRNNHPSTAMVLILHRDASISMRDADGHQALHHSVRNGDITTTAALLNRGAKLNEETKFGWKPIHIATAYGHLPLVAEFITRGVSVEERLGSPAFKPSKKTNEAARKGYWAEIRWPHPGARPLHLALEFGHDEVANILIASGASIEEADSLYWRPIHYAAFNARPVLIDMLITRGASPHATTETGHTALSLGFREPGLVATYDEKMHIRDMLQAAMHSKTKSKFKQFTGFMSVGPMTDRSRDVSDRNKVWHTAELAAALYQNDHFEDGEGEEEQLTPTSRAGGRSRDNSVSELAPSVHTKG